MLQRRAALAGLALTAVGGCAADVAVQSNVDKTYGRKLDRLLIVMSLSIKGHETYLNPDEVSASLKDRFSALGVTVETIVFTGGTAKVPAGFQPTQLMQLTVTSLTTRNGAASSFTLSSDITDVATRKRVWRAEMKFEEAPMAGTMLLRAGAKKAADNLANVLTAKLRADGLVS